MESLLALCVLLVVYTYFGYPIVLWFLHSVLRIRRSPIQGERPDSFAIIIACRNEERVLKQKLEETLSLRFENGLVREELLRENSRVQVIVASDASDDATDEIARSFPHVDLVALAQRGGKEKAQIEALKHVHCDIVLFTDAKISISNDVLSSLAEWFSDQSIGAVSSSDVVKDASGTSGEGAYVDYEMKLRRIESEVSSLVGLSGSCFAVRKSITSNFPEEMSSDFAMSLETRMQGYASVHAENITGTYRAVASHGHEFSRKVRTVFRGISVLMAYRELLNPVSYGLFAFQLLSHKLLRWLVPLALFLITLILFVMKNNGIVYALLFYSMCLFFILVTFGFLLPRLQRFIVFRLPLFFTLSNIAILKAWYLYFRGANFSKWDPSKKGA